MGAAGTDAAMETADVVLVGDKLSRIPYAYDLAKTTVRNMKQNMFLASGMLIHELSVLLVIVNALRLVRYKQGSKNKDTEMSGAILETK